MNNKLFKKTIELWEQAHDAEMLEGIEPDAALGAHYAKLALDGTVELTDTGIEKVEAALQELIELLGEDD